MDDINQPITTPLVCSCEGELFEIHGLLPKETKTAIVICKYCKKQFIFAMQLLNQRK